MATLLGKTWTRKQLLERMGDMSQVATVRPHVLTEGRAKGVSAMEFSTGSGFRFTVLPDRGMDISAAEYCGSSLCWRSATGEVAPTFYQPEGAEWLWGFYGGLVTTCGLTYMGAPCEDQGQKLGLHGRVANTPAKNVSVESGWDGDEYFIGVQGKVVEASVFGPALELTRNVFTFLGQNRLFIHDEVTNIGHEPAPHMMLYHVNVGWPALDAGSRLLAPSLEVTPRDERARDGAEEYDAFHAPQAGFKEKVYFHNLAAVGDKTVAAVVNPDLGFGTYVAFRKSQLPCFIEWKQLAKGTYTVGIEPATNLVTGRDKERAAGRLRMLKPGETAEYDLELGALTSEREVADIEARIRKMMGRRKPRIL